ncbi:IclR family transcriptional regulator [Desemzia sp. RIT804]|uniref:IclR family transcriptional regulator n=1 Tax=Desemzia sp. RIT 804 TaxID=2810209 RepID=UPI001951A3F5|nr:IclR family transcriptional regulator [Desemzia sp. RIT 804]MBM6615463.1 IclR family transcriptional regulator [Desemzia sp. RIT 804]
MANNSPGRVQTIDRALSILEILSNYDNLSLMEISEKVQLHKATTHRLINSLLENGYIEKDATTKKYRISLKLFQLGNRRVQNIDFLNVAKSMIRQLSQEINQTVHLVIEDDNEVLYIDKHDSQNSETRMHSRIGKKAPMYVTAVGKAILATKTNGAIVDYWNQQDIQPKTTHTITNLEKFLAEIDTVRQQGYAIDNEENEYGIVCIGASFASYKELSAGAISISLPLSEVKNKEMYIQKIVETTRKISSLLGHF